MHSIDTLHNQRITKYAQRLWSSVRVDLSTYGVGDVI